MSEKLSEQFAALLDEYAKEPNGPFGRMKRFNLSEFAVDHADAILSALRLAEQPPTDAAGIREAAAKYVEDRQYPYNGLLARGIRRLPLPLQPSPTADALRVAEEALAEATPILKYFAMGETQFSGEGTPLTAFYRCTYALAEIRKTKEV